MKKKNIYISFRNLLFLMLINSMANSVFCQQLRTANGITGIKMFSATSNSATANQYISDTDFKFYAVAVFDHLPNKQIFSALKNEKIELLAWIEKASYIIKITSKSTYLNLIRKVENNEIPYIGIRYVGEIPSSLKLSQSLYRVASNPLSPNINDIKDVTINVFDEKYMPDLKSYLISKTLSTLNSTSTSISVSGVSFKQINDIAALNYVRNISVYSDSLKVAGIRNSVYAQIFPLNYDTANGYIGRNNYVGNIETISTTDPEMLKRYRNRLIKSTISASGNMTSHAEYTTSVIASGNNFDELDGGMAPGSKLIQGYWDADKTLISYAAGYHPLSVSSSIFPAPSGQTLSSVYNTTMSNWDAAIRSVSDLILSTSAGNNGHDSSGNGFGYPTGWNNLVYQTGGKNSLTVSNVTIPGEDSYGSCGPTNDGRLEPLICTEGQSGTSFASPNIAGQVSDLFEAYRAVYNTTPRSDVIKSVLMNTAQDIYKKGPDFRTGYGESNPLEALNAVKKHDFFTGTVEQGESNTPVIQTLNVAEGLRQLRIMLYWHDYQGTPNASKILVNDLDLKVITPTGDTILPWILNSMPDHVADTATRGIDTVNNQEQVTLTNPEAGIYKILVYGKEVPMGPQDYVVTYLQNSYHIKITLPGGFRLPPSNYFDPISDFGFTWDYDLNTDNPDDSMQVFLQRQAGESFVQIGSVGTRSIGPGATGEGVQANESAPVGFYLNYHVPSDFPVTTTAQIIVKQKNHDYADTSGYYQYSPIVEGLKVISSCPEDVVLQWNNMDSLKVGGKYIIYRLGDTLMEPVDSVPYTQDSVTLHSEDILGAGQTFSRDEWFAVAARYPGGMLSYRTKPVTQRNTNPILAGSPFAPGAIPDTAFVLCKNDTALLYVDPNYIKDSIRWFKDGEAVAGGTNDTLYAEFNNFGNYTYKSYYKNCPFVSDTFHVTQNPDVVFLSDTVYSNTQAWRCFVYKGDYGNNNIYGYFDMNQTDLNLHTTDYYNNKSANPWTVSNYVGCPLPTSDFTLVMKRNGFPTGNYDIMARKGLNITKLWIDDLLVYTGPTDLNQNVTVWSGQLNPQSKVRIELRSIPGVVSECAYDFITDVADINLALHKTAFQSSTSTSNGVSQIAANATDGNYSNFSSTTGVNGPENFPYMNIDLGDSASIDKFEIWNRSDVDAAINRLHNYYIFVSNEPFEEANTDPSVIAARPEVSSVYRTDTAGRPTIIGAGFKGRYIRIQMNSTDILNLSEFEAYGQWLNTDSSTYKNLAYLKTATQSSTYSNSSRSYPASNAVDGIIDGAFVDNSVTNTGNSTADMINPWWMVDLGTVCYITKINVYNRTDAGFSSYMQNYNILISSDSLPMSTTTTSYPSAITFHDDNIAGSPTVFNVNTVGRFIALQLPAGENGESGKMIDLAELQALGYEVDSSTSTSENTTPIIWGPFSATPEKNKVLLKWATITEINNKSFDIERLDKNNQFKKIGVVSANNTPSDYDYKDFSPMIGTNTYRLKQYDSDGKFSYSPVRSVIMASNSNNNDFIIQPNPVGDLLKIIKQESVTGALNFRIIDAAGKKIFVWSVENPGTVIEKNISRFVSGIYFLQIETNTGKIYNLKFIKS